MAEVSGGKVPSAACTFSLYWTSTRTPPHRSDPGVQGPGVLQQAAGLVGLVVAHRQLTSKASCGHALDGWNLWW